MIQHIQQVGDIEGDIHRLPGIVDRQVFFGFFLLIVAADDGQGVLGKNQANAAYLEKSFGTLKHIAIQPKIYEDMHRDKRVTSLKGYDFPGMMARVAAEESKPRSKAEIVELLRSEGDRFAAWLESLTPEFLAETFTDPSGQNERSRLESLSSPKEHEMHHRGQLMLIERILGIVPHLTRRRQERMQASRPAS